MEFDEHNRKLIDMLDSAAGSGRVAQAYVLSGEDEEQSLQIAEDFAKKLVGSPLDIIYPEQEKENLIGVQDVRKGLCADAAVKPFGGKKKVYIVRRAELMNIPAQNALLKTLEEPPEYIVILLLTRNMRMLLPTILSRAVKLSVGSSTTCEVSDDTYREMQEKVRDFLRKIRLKDPAEAKEFAQFMTEHKGLSKDACTEFRTFYRDVFSYKLRKDPNILLFRDDMEITERIAEGIGFSGIGRVTEAIDTLETRIDANVSFELAWTMMLLTILDEA